MVRRIKVQTRAVQFLLLFLLVSPGSAPSDVAFTALSTQLTGRIPLRPRQAMTGSEFVRYVAGMDARQREQAILSELLKGNLPDFLRELKPVRLCSTSADGKGITATIFVMPDYLAVGSDCDFLSIPMNLYTATAVAARFGFILPTTKMVDCVYEQAAYQLRPQPLSPGPWMRSTACYLRHHQKISEQCLAVGRPLGVLVSGHKKDVVLTNRLAQKEGRIAIYGWHRCAGAPIQPLSTVHGARYADYSHGIRLVSDTVFIEGYPRSIYDVLEDPRLAGVLSDEGPIRNVRRIMSGQEDKYARISPASDLLPARPAPARLAGGFPWEAESPWGER